MESAGFMRIEAVVALAISTAVHAGIIFVAPGVPDVRGPAQAVAMPPVITAHLKNTLDDAEESRLTELQSARPARPSGGNFASVAAPRNARLADAAGKEQRIDNVLRFYPPEAIRQGLEGEAIVMLRIGEDGNVLAAGIAKSSGHVILDEAALRAIRATRGFPPGSREILFPVTFALH